MTKKKIVWQKNQLIAVAKRSYVIKNSPTFIGTDVEAVRQAQAQVLPAELHRRLISMKDVPRIVYMWKELRHQLYTEQEGAVRRPAADATCPEVESTADLMSKLMTRLADVLDEDRIRRLVREETNRVLKGRVTV